jgi:diguanylate cyclase (GGDEF)-like protein/PAS domain S-box-containing protein
MTQPFANPNEDRSIDLGGGLSQLSSLLSHLDEAPVAAGDSHAQQQMVKRRLGMASSLFIALRARHAPTADHSARVAIYCSSWSLATDMTEQQRDDLEIAALLHDIGKIGIPDSVLRNPNALTADQQTMLRHTRAYSDQILRTVCVSEDVLQTISHVGAWYNGTKQGYDLSGNDIPVASRMIAIADAFDSMTTDRVYRKAMSIDRAIGELFHCAGTQFDRTMVEHFAGIQSSDRSRLHELTTNRWLNTLTEGASNRYWDLRVPSSTDRTEAVNQDGCFHERLMDSVRDGVVFVDASFKIKRWNHACEKLTGIIADAVRYEQWNPQLLNLRAQNGRLIREADCPVRRSFYSGVPSADAMLVKGRDGDFVPVELQAVPVVDVSGIKLGVTIVMRDWSSEQNLQQRVETLHQKATRDPLTGIANRAEFDRVFAETVLNSLEKGTSCSLIICDIDHFKKINDIHGHQAGDEALVRFAAMLARSSRSGDFVARYGGEEFVVVCQDCGCKEAFRLAEKLRLELASSPFKELDGQSITASFGVTEVQAGDTPETMLRRADRGLLQAKDTGRNMVVQLGSGLDADHERKASSWLDLLFNRPKLHQKLVESYLATNVPVNILAQKLQGFVADHDARIVSLDDQGISLEISDEKAAFQRRRNDRGTPFSMHIGFMRNQQASSQVLLCVSVCPLRVRDRRANPVQAARNLISSLKSYLVAQSYSVGPDDHIVPLQPSAWQDAMTGHSA